MEKAEFARKLRTKNRWLVDDSTGIVRTNFTYGGKVVSLEFSKDADGSYRISYPRYNYVSRTSHYTSFEAEARQCMNKSLLFHVIGQTVKAACPAKYGFLMGYTNGYIGYFPEQKAYSEGGYEVSRTHFDPQSERIYLKGIAALMQRLPNAAKRKLLYRTLRVGERVPPAQLAAWLTERGYQRMEAVENPGEYNRGQ